MKSAQSDGPAGWQVAFLVFTVLLLAVPATNFIAARIGADAHTRLLLSRTLMIGTAAAALLLFAPARRASLAMLRVPLQRRYRLETLAVAIAHFTLPFAAVAVMVLSQWARGGGEAIARNMPFDAANEVDRAFTRPALLMLPLAWLAGPVVEELVFRGFMLGAWSRRWGWTAACIATAVVFGIYHPRFLGAFASSLVFAAVYRRTGALWSGIAVHGAGNAMLWAPFLGRFAYVSREDDAASLAAWWPHLACLAFVLVALPAYVWIAARHPHSGLHGATEGNAAQR
jgi:membrane protease YdiL (CAAX protease family)